MSDKKWRNFILLFATCIAGSVAILLFAFGIENGNPTANNILNSALHSKALVFLGAVWAGGLMWLLKNKSS